MRDERRAAFDEFIAFIAFILSRLWAFEGLLAFLGPWTSSSFLGAEAIMDALETGESVRLGHRGQPRPPTPSSSLGGRKR